MKDILDPQKWLKQYYSQKFIAEVLFDRFIEKKQLDKIIKDPENNEYIDIFLNIHFHWGIAIENGLKGIIIKQSPEQVKYVVHGEQLIIKQICGKAGKMHDLLSLGILAGLVTEKDSKTSDNLTVVLLSYLSDMVRWGAKYPGPFNPTKVFRLPDKIPAALIYGFHIFDLIEPVFLFIETKAKEFIK